MTRATLFPLLAPAETESRADAVVRDEFCADLAVVYSFGPPFGQRLVTHEDLRKQDLNVRALRRTAQEQLEQLADRAQFHGRPPALMLSFDGLESSLLLSERFWARMAEIVPGEIVVGVPARDVVIVTGSESAPGLEKARRAVDRVLFAGDEHPLTQHLLVRRNGAWQPFEAAPTMPAPAPAIRLDPHGPNHQPRQYQDHPSWPEQRIPISAMPVSPGDRAASPRRAPAPVMPAAARSSSARPAATSAGVGPYPAQRPPMSPQPRAVTPPASPPATALPSATALPPVSGPRPAASPLPASGPLTASSLPAAGGPRPAAGSPLPEASRPRPATSSVSAAFGSRPPATPVPQPAVPQPASSSPPVVPVPRPAAAALPNRPVSAPAGPGPARYGAGRPAADYPHPEAPRRGPSSGDLDRSASELPAGGRRRAPEPATGGFTALPYSVPPVMSAPPGINEPPRALNNELPDRRASYPVSATPATDRPPTRHRAAPPQAHSAEYEMVKPSYGSGAYPVSAPSGAVRPEPDSFGRHVGDSGYDDSDYGFRSRGTRVPEPPASRHAQPAERTDSDPLSGAWPRVPAPRTSAEGGPMRRRVSQERPAPSYPGSWGQTPPEPVVPGRPTWDSRTGARARFAR
ncbi:hypothetical protein GCM10009681_45380 [Luedemannella helvata]|uniref:Uncharacterized protein n=1 Tax=Luedemannella helvata TaxID=349315 RepID=A0ABN2L0F4_9ACTN